MTNKTFRMLLKAIAAFAITASFWQRELRRRIYCPPRKAILRDPRP